MFSQSKARDILQPWWEILVDFSIAVQLGLGVLFFVVLDRLYDPKAQDGIFRADALFNDTEENGDSVQDEDKVIVNSSVANVGGEILKRKNVFSHNSEILRLREAIFRGPIISGDPELPVILVYTCLVFSAVLGILTVLYNRIFYSNFLVQNLSANIHDLRKSDNEDGRGNQANHLAMTTILHKSNNRRDLQRLFSVVVWIRIVISFAIFIVSLLLLIQIDSDLQTGHRLFALISYSIFFATLGQLGVSMYALLWLKVLCQRSMWGHVMGSYKRATDKMDLARGRTVPTPPFDKRISERILDSLNPYVASENVKLLLDLTAQKCGVGVGLRCLAGLESDVRANWRPFRLEASMASPETGLELSWKDPLAVIYLIPVPLKLRLHYGIEISCSDKDEVNEDDKVIELVGYDESRYSNVEKEGQSWHASSPARVQLKTPASSVKEFVYRERFPKVRRIGVRVNLWTIVDGNLIAKTSVKVENYGVSKSPTAKEDEIVEENDIDGGELEREQRESSAEKGKSGSSFSEASVTSRSSSSSSSGSDEVVDRIEEAQGGKKEIVDTEDEDFESEDRNRPKRQMHIDHGAATSEDRRRQSRGNSIISLPLRKQNRGRGSDEESRSQQGEATPKSGRHSKVGFVNEGFNAASEKGGVATRREHNTQGKFRSRHMLI